MGSHSSSTSSQIDRTAGDGACWASLPKSDSAAEWSATTRETGFPAGTAPVRTCSSSRSASFNSTGRAARRFH